MITSNLNKNQRIFCLLLYVPCLFKGRILDNDIWFLLNSGRYVVRHGIPNIEPFTIHEGLSFVMQQWFSAVIFWNVYLILGEIGLMLLVIIFYALFINLTLKLCMFLSDNNFSVSFTVSMIVSCLMYIFMVERPHIFLFVIIIAEIFLLEKFIRNNKVVYILLLPVLSVLLINLEAAIWPFLFLILIPYFVDSFKFKFKLIEGEGYNLKPILFAFVGMLAVGFINPYGINAVTYLYNSFGNKELHYSINEMLPANINSFMGLMIFASIFIVFFLLASRKKGKYRLRFYLLALGTAVLAISSVRSFCFFIICGIIPLSYYFKDYTIPKALIKNDKKSLIIRKVLVILILIVLIFGISQSSTMIDNKQNDLVKAVDFLEELHEDDMVLYSGFNEGGYIEFRGFRTYIDPRAEVFIKRNNQKHDILEEYMQLLKGEIYYKDVLNKYHFTYLLVSNSDILGVYLDYDDEYKSIYSSGYYKIYEKIE